MHGRVGDVCLVTMFFEQLHLPGDVGHLHLADWPQRQDGLGIFISIGLGLAILNGFA